MAENIKTVSTAFPQGKSDPEVKDMLNAISQPSNASEIIRDVDGKVIEVRVPMPESMSQAAQDALAITPGVSTSVGGPIVPTEWEWDGTQASLDTLLAEPTWTDNNGMTHEDLLDGTYKISSSTIDNNEIETRGGVLNFPNTGFLELKFKFVSLFQAGFGPTFLSLVYSNGGGRGSITLRNDLGSVSFRTANSFGAQRVLPINDTDLHTVKIGLSERNGTFELDGDLLDNIRYTTSSTVNAARVQLGSPGGQEDGIIIDSLKVSKIV
jgi:hypothetical protein